MFNLWRVVDHEGEVLESYVTRTRDKATALSFMKKALDRQTYRERRSAALAEWRVLAS